MAEFLRGLLSLGPWFGGAVAGFLIFVFTNRRPLLTYSVEHQRIGMSAEDAIHGKVEVLYRGNVVHDLYLSVVEIKNRSIRDLEKLAIKTWRASDNMAMLTEEGHIAGTLERVDVTAAYFDRIVADSEWEKQVREAGTAAEPGNAERLRRDFAFRHGQRHYLVPVLNRGQVIRITYLTTAGPGASPAILVDCPTKGVRVKYKPYPQSARSIFGVPVVYASQAGLLIGVVATAAITTAFVSQWQGYVWLAAPICFAIGLFVSVPGALALKAYIWARSKLVG